MSDIFISHAREDQERIDRLAAALEGAGFSIWWDRRIDAGTEFSKDIEERLTAAKVVIVAWSAVGNASTWVRDEASFALNTGKLLPIRLDTSNPPLGFQQFHAFNFAKWRGDPAAEEFSMLVASLRRRIEGEATGAGPAPPPAQGFARFAALVPRPAVLAGVAVLIGLIAVTLLMFLRPASAPSSPPEAGEAATRGANAETGSNLAAAKNAGVGLVVIPFLNLSSDPEQEHFADGLTEELLNWLGNVEGLRVPGRMTSFQFKGKAEDLRAVGAALGVSYVLEGSVRRSGEKLRITAQLIDAKSGNHLWSEAYDRTLDDIFAIQDEIARIVVTELLGKIPETGAANPAAIGDVNPKAHELYLEGRALEARNGLDAGFPKFQAAVATDPRHFLAQARIAVIAAFAQATANGLPGLEIDKTATADEALAAAVRLNPKSADVLFAQGAVAQWRSGEWRRITNPAVIDYYQRAVRANPRHVGALNALVWVESNSVERRIELLERVLEIDPADARARFGLIMAHVERGDRDKALIAGRQSLAFGSDVSENPPTLAGWLLGDMALVGAALFSDFEASEGSSRARWSRASLLTSLGALEEARFLWERETTADYPPMTDLARYFLAVLEQNPKAALSAAEEAHGFKAAPFDSTLVLAVALIGAGNPGRAYDVLLETRPDLANPNAKDIVAGDMRHIDLVLAAHALDLMGRRVDARALWRAALAVAEAKPAFTWEEHLERALLHDKLGNKEAAIRSFRAAYDAGFRYPWSYFCSYCVGDGFYNEHGLYAELLKHPEIAALVDEIEAENARTLADFNKKYGILDHVREMMAAERAEGRD